MDPITMAAVAKTSGAIKNATESMYQEHLKGGSTFGAYEEGSNLYKLAKLGIYASNVEASAEDAKRIDGFFTRFGYAQNKIMKPNPKARTYFTYIQTGDDCYTNKYGAAGNTQGSANAKQISEINDILKKGVTFWSRTTTIDDMFKYNTLDNAPADRK